MNSISRSPVDPFKPCKDSFKEPQKEASSWALSNQGEKSIHFYFIMAPLRQHFFFKEPFYEIQVFILLIFTTKY